MLISKKQMLFPPSHDPRRKPSPCSPLEGYVIDIKLSLEITHGTACRGWAVRKCSSERAVANTGDRQLVIFRDRGSVDEWMVQVPNGGEAVVRPVAPPTLQK